jgi:hypothetical protein
MRKFIAFVVLSFLLFALATSPASAQGADDDEGVIVRVNGDAAVPAGEAEGVVVVVDGNLEVEGTATTVVVISGRADLVGATVETLVVVDGTANLGAATRITGDVHLVESDLIRDPSATVAGSIESGTGDFTRGFWIVGFLFMLGWAVMTVLASLVLAAVAPQFARRTGRAITNELGPTIIAGLILWIVVPIVGVLLFATVIGIPTALTIWFGLLPVVGFIGLLVAGVRLGEYVTGGRDGVGHPYLAAVVGAVFLVVVGAIPFLGPIVIPIAGFLGSGAMALQAFKSVRSQPEADVPAVPAPAPTPTSTPAAPVAEG